MSDFKEVILSALLFLIVFIVTSFMLKKGEWENITTQTGIVNSGYVNLSGLNTENESGLETSSELKSISD